MRKRLNATLDFLSIQAKKEGISWRIKALGVMMTSVVPNSVNDFNTDASDNLIPPSGVIPLWMGFQFNCHLG